MPNEDSPAVKMYRDKFKLNLNIGRKEDIDLTITDLNLWDHVLNNWGYYSKGKWVKYSPLNISALLSEYERLERKNGHSATFAAASTQAKVWE